MLTNFTSWKNSPWLIDPIKEARTGPRKRGASNFPLPEIFSMITNIEYLDTTETLVWRGHSDISYPLTTNLQRVLEKRDGPEAVRTMQIFQEKQEEILQLAHRRGIGQSQFGVAERLQTFAELQHQGVPTHLLDITLDPLTALWFASRNHNAKKDGVLFAFSVSKFSPRFTADPPQPTVGNPKPIYLKPSAPDRRMFAQRAAFLVPVGPTLPNSSGFENFTIAKGDGLSETLRKKILAPTSKNPPTAPPKCYFVAIRIPSASKTWITKRLESGEKLTHESLFPDIFGLAQYFAR